MKPQLHSSLSKTNATRRNLLMGSASAGVLGWLAPGMGWAQSAKPKPLPALASFKDLGSMIVHSSNTIETTRAAMGGVSITPISTLYMRNNLGAPDAKIVEQPDVWQLEVAGVRKPRTLTVAELKAMGSETLYMVLQCSGNGRGFFPNKPKGTPWQVGAAGCVVWTGVPVRTVVKALGGVERVARFMTGTGGEVLPAGLDPKTRVERSVPLEAMQDAILAWELNGQPIPLAHGGPLRLVVPGYTGVNSIKYVKRLAFTAEESDSTIQQTNYRLTSPGESASAKNPSVWQMLPKSFVTSPLPEGGELKAGPVRIQGVAFGGMHGVAKVDVSVDGGASWQPARLVGPDLGRYAWRVFELDVQLPAGSHTITSRMVDTRGTVQEELRVENLGGYINSSWRDHAVTVKVA